MTIRHTDPQRHDSPAQTCAAAQPPRPVLNRLIGSKRGNVLPILAASILPMAAMIGGAVDMSRAYMVKSRIQHACDAGVLAGRRAMERGEYNSAAQTQAQDFFDVNFKEGYNRTTDVVFSTSNPLGTSKVLGTASTIMPTTIMGMFGKETLTIAVSCEAELNLSNTDVTFVLDVTGSMKDAIPTGNGGSIVKMTALRNSVLSFYDTLASAAEGSKARLRYSFVPYSSNVNVGELLYDTNPQWLIGANVGESWSYQSRKPIWNVSSTSSQTIVDNETFGSTINATNCNSYGNNNSFTQGFFIWFSPNPSGSPTVQVSGNTKTTTSYTPSTWGGAAPSWSGTDRKTCVRQRTRVIETTTTTESTTWQPGATFANKWEYGNHSFRVDEFVKSIKSANPAVQTPSEGTSSTSRWGGCIEERTTIAGSTIAYGSNGITVDGSTNAHDLNIDSAPVNNATRWRPYWEHVYYLKPDFIASKTHPEFSFWPNESLRSQGGTGCPGKATLLSAMDRSQVQTYVNGLVPIGGTYHDSGLLWGARLASPQGLFQSIVNANPGNAGTVSRHMIFMTDGALSPYDFVAGMYGIEDHEQRITGGSTNPNQLERHRQRYLAICEAIKGKGIRLWVIAFGTTLTTDLESCASSGSAFTAANSTSLNAAFQNIAKQISELRLTK